MAYVGYNPLARFADRNPVIIRVINWILRIFVGGLFIFSGFTKGIDPWGTIYKFNEYFSAWGYNVWDALNVSGVFILCLVEFITGFSLVMGCFRRATPIVALVIMLFMLPLTLWLAIENPISDCGCFGDALKLTNWQTFYKNVIITLGTLWLLLFNNRSICLIHPYLQWIATVGAGLYIFCISWLGFYYQPLLDFRPYKTGSELFTPDTEDNDDPDGQDNLVFVYEKDGVQKEFSLADELPDEDEGWKFVARKYREPVSFASSPSVGEAPSAITPSDTSKTIRFYSEDGLDDVTEEVIGQGRQLILMIPKLSEVSAAKTWKINSFYQWCQDNDIEMIAAVGGNPRDIETWKDISLAEYPFYTSDDTAIEEVVRGNPGVVYLEDGIIKWKSSLKAIDIDDFQDPQVSTNPMAFARDDKAILYNLTWIFLIFTAVMVVLSFFPRVIGIFFRSRRKERFKQSKRLLAEWDDPKAILLTLPSDHTDWNDILPEALDQYRRIIGAFIEGGEKIMLVCGPDAPQDITSMVRENGGTVVEDIDFNDTWTRDYGPISVEKDGRLRELDFGFNGWGLKFASDKDNLVNLRLKEKGYRRKSAYTNNRDYTLEGGSIETDGFGTLLTTSRCLCSPERNGGKSKEEVEKILKSRLGIERVLWLDHGFLEGDDTDSHIDTLARLAPNDSILYVAPPADENDVHHSELKKMEQQLKDLSTAEGKPYRLFALPFPNAIFDEEGNRLPATYANYLVTARSIYMPVYGQPENDARACKVVLDAFPNHKLYTVDCSTLIKQHGSLHCSTMQLYYEKD